MIPNIMYVVVCRNLENTTASYRHQTPATVRQQYIDKFRFRLASDLFTPFNSNASEFDAIIDLTGDRSNALVIQSSIIKTSSDSLNAIKEALNHPKVNQLFPTFYALGIDLIGIIPLSGTHDISHFLLQSETEVAKAQNNTKFPNTKFIIVNP